ALAAGSVHVPQLKLPWPGNAHCVGFRWLWNPLRRFIHARFEHQEQRAARLDAHAESVLAAIEEVRRAFACLRVPPPRSLAAGGELDIGLDLALRIGIGEEEDLPLAAPQRNLAEVHVGARNAHVRLDSELLLDAAVPRQNIGAGRLDHRAPLAMVPQNALRSRTYFRIGSLPVLETRRAGGRVANKNDAAAPRSETLQSPRRIGLHGARLYHDQGAVIASAHRQAAGDALRFAEQFLVDVVAPAAILVDRLPELILVRRHVQHGEWLALHTVGHPQIRERVQDGDLGPRIAALQQRREPRLVIRKAPHEGPPRVALIEERTVADPAGERRFGRTVIETVEYGVGDAGEIALVGAVLQAGQSGVEHHGSVRDLFAAHQAFAGETRRRGDELVDAGGRAMLPRSHLRIHPGLAFGDIHFHAAFQRMIRRTVGLHARLHAVLCAPLPVSAGESFTEQFDLQREEVVADPLNDFPRRIAQLGLILVRRG